MPHCTVQQSVFTRWLQGPWRYSFMITSDSTWATIHAPQSEPTASTIPPFFSCFSSHCCSFHEDVLKFLIWRCTAFSHSTFHTCFYRVKLVHDFICHSASLPLWLVTYWFQGAGVKWWPILSTCSFYIQFYHKGKTHLLKLLATNYRELLYGTDYLCVDTYFRSYMDVEGYVPMALLCSYPNIACYATPIEELVQKLAAKEDSLLEVDSVNETVRLKEGWEKVIINWRMFYMSAVYDRLTSSHFNCLYRVMEHEDECSSNSCTSLYNSHLIWYD